MVRIVARLDIKGPNLVKGIHFEGLRVLGDPGQFAKKYYEAGADELFYMDAVASLYQRNSLIEVVRNTATEIFIPVTVGGGLRTVDDIREILRVGADKVAINTAAIRRPDFIQEAAELFGSSTIVLAIDAMQTASGNYEAYTEYGRERTGIEAVSWAVKGVKLGAGEIIVTSIDREGTGRGFDIDLTRTISEAVSVPVIACGGAGSPEDVYQALNEGKADAAAVASILHYREARGLCPDGNDNRNEGNVAFLRDLERAAPVKTVTIKQIKTILNNSGMDCRI